MIVAQPIAESIWNQPVKIGQSKVIRMQDYNAVDSMGSLR